MRTGTDLLVLLALADYADDRGYAYPAVRSIATKARTSPRTVQRTIERLASEGHLQIHQTKGGRSSNTYRILMPSKTDKNSDQTPETEQSATKTGASEPTAPSPNANSSVHTPDNVTPLPRHPDTPALPDRHPSSDNLTGPVIHTPDNLTPQPCHSYDTPGVTQLCHPNHHRTTIEPFTTKAAKPNAEEPTGGGGGQLAANNGSTPSRVEPTDPEVARVLDSLPAAWNLGPVSRRRLTPAVRTALNAGWTPSHLAEHLGANPEGVHSPAAVLAARLRDLPHPPDPKPSLPPWCGQCDDPVRRFVETDDGRPAYCPTCNPKASAA